MSPVYIAILSLSLWGLLPGLSDLATTTEGARLPRRATAGFLALIAAQFAVLWLSEIAGSIRSGVLPASVAVLDVPTSAVYALDLGIVLPLFVFAAVQLVRRSRGGAPLALGSLVFLILMALSILPMFAIQAVGGGTVDPVAALIFVMIAGVAFVFVGVAVAGRPAASHRPAAAASR